VGGGGFYSPRGIDWTADGHTAYIADFDGGVIMKFTNASPKGKGSAILDPVTDLGMTVNITEEGKKVIVADFRLLPNFPNPFNPTTNIPFEIQSERNVKLTVYDMLGREIATLLNDKVQAVVILISLTPLVMLPDVYLSVGSRWQQISRA
jgi:hypothetical protein